MITPDMDETARLLLMDDDPPKGVIEFNRRLRDNISERDNDQAKIVDVHGLWKKYVGLDGRTLPTHSIETGQRLR